jgi:hypothetical protein
METPRIVKIENEDTLVRDTKTNAVLNTDMTALQQYRAKRDRDRQMIDDVENLKKDMSEIKELLQQLVNRD